MSSHEQENSPPLQHESATHALLGTPSAGHGSDVTRNWRECFPEIIGKSPSILNVLETISKVAKSDSAVLIFGESGTGKELVAAALHRLSPRSHRKFVPINCSAIPESLLESELFGHERGAFTGAIQRRAGHFEVADGGTLFLDEIGDMPLRLQAKLLRVLQEKQFTSVGGHGLKNSDVRIVAATNIDLIEAVRTNRFRLDLYYRLNVLPIQLPALRERKQDIADLLEYFVGAANRIHSNSEPCYLSQEVVNCLTDYPWPGNIRELQNLVERLVVMRLGGEIILSDLPPEYLANSKGGIKVSAHSSQTTATLFKVPDVETLPRFPHQTAAPVLPTGFGELPAAGVNLSSLLEGIESDLISQALVRTSNNKNQAAKLLGLNRTTLVERLKKRRIQVKD